MKQNQYQKLTTALRRKAHTTMEMMQAIGSVCPWKRLSEAVQGGYLRAGEKLVEGTRKVNGRTLKTWAIRKSV